MSQPLLTSFARTCNFAGSAENEWMWGLQYAHNAALCSLDLLQNLVTLAKFPPEVLKCHPLVVVVVLEFLTKRGFK